MQPKYPLHVGGKKIGEYWADFVYYDHLLKERVVVDVKGVETDIFKWKRKHFEAEYGIAITVVRV